MRYLELSAKQDNRRAQLRLGEQFYSGDIKAAQKHGRNLELAEKWFRLATASYRWEGDAAKEKLKELGELKQELAFLATLQKKAEEGDPHGQLMFGLALSTGKRVPRDTKTAAIWYRKAADQGLAAAQKTLADAYRSGEGLRKNENEAIAWYRKAAEQQGIEVPIYYSRLALAKKYEAQKNNSESVKWYNLAAEWCRGNGGTFAVMELRRLDKENKIQSSETERTQVAAAVAKALFIRAQTVRAANDAIKIYDQILDMSAPEAPARYRASAYVYKGILVEGDTAQSLRDANKNYAAALRIDGNDDLRKQAEEHQNKNNKRLPVLPKRNRRQRNRSSNLFKQQPIRNIR
jgi:TPR repeat protein